VATIIRPKCGPNAKPSLRKIEAVAHRATDTVVGNPADERLVYAPLVEKIL
jgi:hypothetical protein